MLCPKFIFDNIIQQKHVLNMFYRLVILGCLRPAETFACIIILCLKISGNLCGLAFFHHPFRNRAALLLYHGEVLIVFMSVEEKFARIKLYQDAGHRPNIRGFVPRSRFKNDFRCSVLASVDNKGMVLIVVGGASKINNFNITLFWL